MHTFFKKLFGEWNNLSPTFLSPFFVYFSKPRFPFQNNVRVIILPDAFSLTEVVTSETLEWPVSPHLHTLTQVTAFHVYMYRRKGHLMLSICVLLSYV